MRPLLLAVSVGLALTVMDVRAAESRADQWFTEGVEAFNEGDFDAAVQLLERAREAGKDSSGLIYNLGVAHFRAGHLDAAGDYFRRLTDIPEEAALANYNLGLIALERDQPGRAIRYFENAAAPDAPSRIRGLAREQLARIDKPRPFAEAALGEGNALIGIAGGYEDNLNLASDDNLEEDAAFQDGFVWVSQDFARIGPVDLRATGLANAREYTGVSAADQQLARPGLALDYEGDAWYATTIVDSEWQWLDGDRVERRDRLRLEFSRGIGAGRIEAGGDIVNVSAGSSFEELDGNDRVLDLRLLWPWMSGALVSELEYEFTDENRDDFEQNGTFSSTSAARNRLSSSLRYYPGDTWEFRVTASYRHSRFSDPEVRNGVERRRRREERWRLSGRVLYDMGSGWSLTFSPEWEENSARRDARDYDRFEVRAGVQKQFGWN